MVGNVLHVYTLTRRCVHFVDEVVKFLESRRVGKDPEGKSDKGMDDLTLYTCYIQKPIKTILS